MPVRSATLLALGVLFGTLLSAGCTPDSSGSPTRADTSSTPTAQPASAGDASSASRPPRPTPDESRTVAERIADATVAARIKQALVRRRDLRQFDFYPQVVRGRAVLRGDVDTRDQYRRAERVADAVEGVDTLINLLTVDGEAISPEKDPGATAPPEATYHTVEPGDSLWKIARAHDVSVGQIRALNTETSSLQPGQRIRIR